MVKENPWTGTGPGTFAISFPKYQPAGLGKLFTMAHNDYLHFIAEVGLFALPLLFWMVMLFFKKGIADFKSSSRQKRGIALAGMAGVIAILVHSAGDFNLHIPANAIFFTPSLSLGMPLFS